jgi:hypothetical protein
MVIPPAPFIEECLDPSVVITSYNPSSTQKCDYGFGVADVFTNKLQGKDCVSCKDIYDDAMEREEAGEGDQAYDKHVARSLCDDSHLEGDNKYW